MKEPNVKTLKILSITLLVTLLYINKYITVTDVLIYI